MLSDGTSIGRITQSIYNNYMCVYYPFKNKTQEKKLLI